MILAANVFRFLENDSFYKGFYLVHDDGKYVGRFYAKDDDEAIRLFLSGEYEKIMSN